MPARALVLGFAIIFPLVADACKTDELHPADPGANRWTGRVNVYDQDLDILFVIDDSSGMASAQNNLIANFPTFMATLQAGLAYPPDVHIAVLSQDMGAGNGSIPGCDNEWSGAVPGGGKGIFQYTPRGTCSASNLKAGSTFISNVGGYPNFTGNIEDVFACIAPLGESGCGFNHQFAAVLRALGADHMGQAPAENVEFLRPEAVLGIVFLTNEDDCSATPYVPLFDITENELFSSQLGPATHFRCNEFGHTCPTGVIGANRKVPHPDRQAPNNDVNQTVSYENCASDDTEGYLLSTKQTADAIKHLKADPASVVVASIQGAPTPYAVQWSNPTPPDTSCGAASCPWPAISHACTAPDGRYGDPGVRTAQLAQEFGPNGLVLSVCDGSFATNLERIATLIRRPSWPACIPGPVGLNASGNPDCKVTNNYDNGTGGTVSATVPACIDVNNTPPCWQLQTSANCWDQMMVVSADPSASTAQNMTTTFDCAK